MPALNPRINMVCDSRIFEIVSELANAQCKSLSAIAQELIIEALERREDMYFSKLAAQRAKTPSRHVSHDDAWK